MHQKSSWWTRLIAYLLSFFFKKHDFNWFDRRND